VDRSPIPLILPPRRTPSRLDGPCAGAAWLLPLLLGLWCASGRPIWQEDLAIIRDIGFVPVGSEGTLSTVLAQLCALAPVGGRMFRASLIGVVALALCSRLLFASLRDLLDAEAPFGANPLLALLATQLWALDPATQAAAARIGGPALPLLLIAIGLRWSARLVSDARWLPLAGVLLALTAGESHVAGVLLGLILLSGVVTARGRLGAAALPGFGLGLSAGLGLCALARGLRSLSPNTWVDLGWTLPQGLDGLSAEAAPLTSVLELAREMLALWMERLGAPAALLALAGASWAWLRPGLRRALLPWALLAIGAGALTPLGPELGLGGARELFVMSSSLGAVAFVPLLLQALARWSWSCALPFGRPAGVLLLTFATTLVLQQLDERGPASSTRELGVELWTEEALGRLPPDSLLLVRSPALAFRLMSAQISGGDRPDVAIVATSLLGRGSVTERLNRAEPELSPLLRQLTVNGFADEYSLSGVADARPLFVELDPNWDLRLLEHLRPDAMWLGFSPHALGVSDRHAGLQRSREALRRSVLPIEAHGALDLSTRHALAELVGQQALTVVALGDRQAATRLLGMLRRLGPQNQLALELGTRLRQSERGRPSVADLID
jgi:hypothetical protein